MLNHPRNITMRAFLERLRPFMDSIKEGDNGDFYIDRGGIRINTTERGFPDMDERDALGLSNDERDALLDFEDECPLSFPCSEPEFIGWVGSILGIEIPASEQPLEPLRSAECAHAEPAPEGGHHRDEPAPAATLETAAKSTPARIKGEAQERRIEAILSIAQELGVEVLNPRYGKKQAVADLAGKRYPELFSTVAINGGSGMNCNGGSTFSKAWIAAAERLRSLKTTTEQV